MNTSLPAHNVSTTSKPTLTFSSLHSSHLPWTSMPLNITITGKEHLETNHDSTTDTLSMSSVVSTAVNAAPHLHYYVQVVLAIGVSCIVFLTIAANILVILSFCRYKQLRGFNQYFILSLAVSDLMVGCVAMPLYGVVFILGYWPFGEIFCDIFVFCDHSFSHFSVVSAVVISLDRFVALTKPFFHRHSWRTKRNAALLITLTYLIPTLIWIPITVLWPVFAGGRTVQTNTCQPQYVESLAASILAPVIFFWIPVTVVIVLYYHVNRRIAKALLTTKQRKTEQMLGLKSEVNRYVDASVSESPPAMNIKTAQTEVLTVPPIGTSNVDISEHEVPNRLIKSISESTFLDVSVIGLENKAFSTAVRNEECNDQFTDMKDQSSRGLARRENANRPNMASTVGPNNTGTFLEAAPGNLTRDQAASTPDPAEPKETPAGRQAPGTASGGSRVSERRARVENTRATRMLGFIIAAMIVTWLPWAVLVIVINLCQDCLPEFLYAVSVFLGYMNSTLNPFCYAIADRRFRQAFRRILRHPCGTGSAGSDPYAVNYSTNCGDGTVK